MCPNDNPFFAATTRGADKQTEARHEAEKAKTSNWDDAFSPMRQVRRRLDQAKTPEERRIIRETIAKMPNAKTKMEQLLAGYRK